VADLVGRTCEAVDIAFAAFVYPCQGDLWGRHYGRSSSMAIPLTCCDADDDCKGCGCLGGMTEDQVLKGADSMWPTCEKWMTLA